VTDGASNQYKYRISVGSIVGITMPGNSSETVTASYDSSARVTSVVNAAGTTTYSKNDPAATAL
jgi:hypothetical protein